MKVTLVACDRCKDRIGEGAVYVCVTVTRHGAGWVPPEEIEELELCPGCYEVHQIALELASVDVP